MLSFIDRLPRHTYYGEAVANDPEHMAMLVEATRGQQPDPRPRLSSWSPEVEATTQVADLVKALLAVTISLNSKKGSKKPDATPALRPGTVMDEVRRQARRKRHEEIVARVRAARERVGEEATE